jgi:hypothetical protein
MDMDVVPGSIFYVVSNGVDPGSNFGLPVTTAVGGISRNLVPATFLQDPTEAV